MIKLGEPTKRSQVTDFQAQYLARAIQKLERAAQAQYGDRIANLPVAKCAALWDLAETEDFMLAALACGFVCSDFDCDPAIEEIHRNSERHIPQMSFVKLRWYIHNIQRYTKWNSQYPAQLHQALASGALGLVADRLAWDMSLRMRDDPVEDRSIA